MMFAATVLMVATLAAPGIQRQDRPSQTDETVSVTKGARLTVDNFAGEVIIKTWDRDSLRVQARHGDRARVNIRTVASGVTISAQQNAPRSVDYEITAPAWMPIKVTGTYNFITVDGAQSEVSAETTQGDVIIKGGTGTVTARSIMGEVIVEGARGRVTATSVNEGVRVSGASGDVSVETTNGDISLIDIKSQSVEATTINGSIDFEGLPADRGRYRFTTHNGNITMAIPESSNVTLTVRTYQGRFVPAINVNGPPRSEVRQGRRTVYTLGNGSAEMEVESFGGSIRLVPPGSLSKDKKKDKKD